MSVTVSRRWRFFVALLVYCILNAKGDFMRGLICPISPLRVNENVARVTAFLIVILVALYIFFPNPYLPLFLGIDFYIRGFTSLRYSPLSWLAAKINAIFQWPVLMTDKAKKIFAARVGFLFSAAILIFFFASPV